MTHFPKSERFTLVADIKRLLIEILGQIVRANKTRNKLPILFDIDVNLEVLRSLLRLSTELKFLPFKKYELSSIMVCEVGKLLGGWIRSSK
jgi:hypothetical protein